MRRLKEWSVAILCRGAALCSILLFGFVLFYILHESLSFWREDGLVQSFSTHWQPLNDQFGMLIALLGTVSVALLGVLISLPIALGITIFATCYLTTRWRTLMGSFCDMLAGIPSVVMGFFGLIVLLPMIENSFALSTGESVLSAGILLAVMLLPYEISALLETAQQLLERYWQTILTFGVSKAYFARRFLLPNLRVSLISSFLLAFARGAGETMAVMMVIGNSNLLPSFLGKSSTIQGRIALEMGMAVVGGKHYQALFASAFILTLLILLVNLTQALFQKWVQHEQN